MYYKNKLGVNRELGKLKCAEQTVDAVVSVKSEHVLLTKRSHAHRVATLRVHPPTTLNIHKS